MTLDWIKSVFLNAPLAILVFPIIVLWLDSNATFITYFIYFLISTIIVYIFMMILQLPV